MNLSTLMLLVLSMTQGAPTPQEVVARYVKAVNARDTQTIALLLSKEAAWYSVEDGALTIETKGAQELVAFMRRYFELNPTARTELLSASAAGRFVTTVERARWTAGAQRKERCAIAVYEVREQQIAAAWYFPTTSCEKD